MQHYMMFSMIQKQVDAKLLKPTGWALHASTVCITDVCQEQQVRGQVVWHMQALMCPPHLCRHNLLWGNASKHHMLYGAIIQVQLVQHL